MRGDKEEKMVTTKREADGGRQEEWKKAKGKSEEGLRRKRQRPLVYLFMTVLSWIFEYIGLAGSARTGDKTTSFALSRHSSQIQRSSTGSEWTS